MAVEAERDTRVLGIAVMLLAMFLFTLNDAIGKWLVATYSVGQVLLIRSAAALVVLLPFMRLREWRALTALERPRLQALRVFLASAEVFCFYAAVRYLPLADVMTFWLAAPIYVAAASPFLLGERVSRLRWACIAVGFMGVLLALAPSGAVSPGASIIAIIGTMLFAGLIVTGRSLRGTPDRLLVFWQLIGALAVGAVTAPFGWATPGAGDLALLAGLGVVAMGAHMGVSRALKLADASVVAPLQYTMLIWAILFGWLFFGDLPGPMMLAGAALILCAGLVMALFDRPARRVAGV
ncbi:MAG: DMT family transporter [Paracoccus sp. (in: a-proteobacteria)]|nr:DMT family transporter [Paracoccus sp. (in: a-proteobacteria)]